MPDSGGLLTAKANFLRKAGLLSESLAVAEKMISDQPKYTSARFSCAATLVTMGRNEEARQILPANQNLRSELDWMGPRIYAIALAAEGRFHEAYEKLERALESCPWRRELARLLTTLGYVQMKIGNSGDSVKTLERDITLLDEGTQQIRKVFLGQAQAMQGNYSVANTLLVHLVSTQDPQLRSLRQKYLTSIHNSHLNPGENPDCIELQLLLTA
jgi:tetratricopeptide (TPR) repeat protein